MGDYINLISSGSYFLLSFLVLVNIKKVNITGNKFLAGFFFMIALIFLGDPVEYGGVHLRHPWLIGVFNFPVFALGPSLFYSIVFFVSPNKKFSKLDILLLLPFLILSILNLLYMLIPASIRLEDLEAQAKDSGNYWESLVFVILPLTFYWFLSYRKLIRHSANLKIFASTTEEIDLYWLRKLLIGLAVMIFTWAFELVYNLNVFSQLANGVYWSFSLYLAYYALKQEEIFALKTEEVEEIESLLIAEKRQLLSDEKMEELKANLLNFMNQEKPFLDSTLNLPKLAKMLQLSAHELSYLINEGLKDNFFGFVNKYRVTESQKLMADSKYSHLSMIGIAFEAGFNSKTAFNIAFKKYIGCSPSDYKKSLSA